jgi:hypothetical protein
MAAGSPKDEYLDASSNARQFQTIRFAQLTVYLALMGFILNVLFAESSSVTGPVSSLLRAGGLISTLLFWVHQERTMAFWDHFVDRAAELEEELGFKQYRTRPPAGIISSFKAMRLFFLILTLFWASSFFWFVQ